MRSIFRNITAELFVEMLARCLASICTGRNATVVALGSRQCLWNAFDRLIFCTIFWHWIWTCFMIRIATVDASILQTVDFWNKSSQTQTRKTQFTLIPSTLGPTDAHHNACNALALCTNVFPYDADARSFLDDGPPNDLALISPMLI